MRPGVSSHKRGKPFIIDMSDVEGLSIGEITKLKFPVYDVGGHGKRIGDMTVKQFLEKFG